MGDVKWIKLQVDIFDNRKIKQIRKLPEGTEVCLMWFQLMCLAGSINDYGQIYITKDIPYTEETLATEFDLPINTVKLGLQYFERFGMIQIEDNILRLSSWERYQSLESRDKYREYQRQYHREYRAKQKALQAPMDTAECADDESKSLRKCLRKYDVNTQEERIKKKEKEVEVEEERESMVANATTAPTKGKRFIKPTLEEIEAYMEESGNYIDAERFLDYYDSNGWMVGKNHMKDWKATVRTWAKKEKTQPQPKQEQPKQRPGNYFIPTGETTDYQDDEDQEPLIPEEIVKQGLAAQNKWLEDHGY